MRMLCFIFALLLAAGGLTNSMVAGAPPEANDAHGDPLPPGALARLGTVRFRHGKGIEAIAYSPDGKTIASAGTGGSLVLHDATTGKRLRTFPGKKTPNTYRDPVAFSPDRKTLAAAEDGLARREGLHRPAQSKRRLGCLLGRRQVSGRRHDERQCRRLGPHGPGLGDGNGSGPLPH